MVLSAKTQWQKTILEIDSVNRRVKWLCWGVQSINLNVQIHVCLYFFSLDPHPTQRWIFNSGVNISQRRIYLRGEYFSCVNIFHWWIFFRGKYFSGVNISQFKFRIRTDYFGLVLNRFRSEISVKISKLWFLNPCSTEEDVDAVEWKKSRKFDCDAQFRLGLPPPTHVLTAHCHIHSGKSDNFLIFRRIFVTFVTCIFP